MQTHMTDTEYERIVDKKVQRRLTTDHRYLYAENAEEQAEAEEQITREVEAAMGHAASADA